MAKTAKDAFGDLQTGLDALNIIKSIKKPIVVKITNDGKPEQLYTIDLETCKITNTKPANAELEFDMKEADFIALSTGKINPM